MGLIPVAGLVHRNQTLARLAGSPWETPAPRGVDTLVAELLARGCHQTDIGDAFYKADPEWLSRTER